MKVAFATLLLLTLLLSSAFLEVTMASSGTNCQSKCEVRCSKSKKKPRCLKYCILCCKDCNCVPSGTYGNKHQCPCYKGMRNSKGNPKCP